MKKIVLGCAAVLLSLGLLAGCNNEEKAVSITVDSAATVIVGETLELPYSVDPEKAEVVAESSNDSVLEAVAQEGILYLEGIAEGSASVTLMGTYKKYTDAFASVSVTVTTKATEDTEPGPDQGGDGDDDGGDSGTTGPGEQVITLSGVPETLDLVLDGETGTITPVVTPAEANIDVDYDETIVSVTNTAAVEGEYEFTVTPLVEGTTNIVFTASLDDYEDVTATTAVTVHEADWEPEPEPEPGIVTGVTLSITLEYQSQTVETIPEYVDLYILGTWKNAEMNSLDDAELLTQGEGCVFTLLLTESLEVGEWYNYKIYAAYTEASGQDTTLEWSHCLYSSGNGYFQVDENVTSGSTLNLVAEIDVDPTTVLGDPSVGPFTNYTIHFYFTDGDSTYYTLPDYADAYLTGDLFKSGSDWTYGDATKLTAGTDGSGNTYYSYTFDEIEAGTHTLAIYLEYNSTAPSGVQVTIPSWGHQYGYNFSYTVENTDTSESENDYILVDGDPANYIADPTQTCEVTVALANSGSNSASTTPKIKGTFDGWAAEYSFTADGNGYKYTIESVIGNDVEFGVYTNSSWNDHLVVTNTGNGLSMSGSDIVIDGSYVTGDLTLTLTFDFGLFGQGSTISATGAIEYAQ